MNDFDRFNRNIQASLALALKWGATASSTRPYEVKRTVVAHSLSGSLLRAGVHEQPAADLIVRQDDFKPFIIRTFKDSVVTDWAGAWTRPSFVSINYPHGQQLNKEFSNVSCRQSDDRDPQR